jgi:hypothetical protein
MVKRKVPPKDIAPEKLEEYIDQLRTAILDKTLLADEPRKFFRTRLDAMEREKKGLGTPLLIQHQPRIKLIIRNGLLVQYIARQLGNSAELKDEADLKKLKELAEELSGRMLRHQDRESVPLKLAPYTIEAIYKDRSKYDAHEFDHVSDEVLESLLARMAKVTLKIKKEELGL